MSSPILKFSPEILVQAQGKTSQGIRAAIFDVDGVLTDGRIYYTAEGEQLKVFNVMDGQGFLMLEKAGIKIIVITGRDSLPVRQRMKDFDIEHVCFGVKNKLHAATEILESLNILWSELAVIGDDWPDLPLLTRAAFAAVPANAHEEAKAVAHYVTKAAGGQGAVREFCDILLMAGAHYDRIYQQYLGPQDE